MVMVVLLLIISFWLGLMRSVVLEEKITRTQRKLPHYSCTERKHAANKKSLIQVKTLTLD